MAVNILAGLGSALAGGLTGYKLSEDMNRQKKDDAYKEEVRSRQRQDWKEDDTYKADMKQATAPATAVPTPQVVNDDQGNPLPGVVPVSTVDVNGQTFPNQAAAASAVGAANAPVNRYASMAAAAEKNLKFDQAQRFHTLADQYKKEGATEFINGISAITPNVEGLKAAGGTVTADIPDALSKDFNATGAMKVPAGAKVEHFINKYSDGTEFADSRVVDKDGKPLVQSLRTVEATLLKSAHERSQEDMERQKQGDTRGYQTTMAGVAQKNANTNEGWRQDQTRLKEEELGIMRQKAATAAAGAGSATPAEYDFTGEAAKITEETAKAAAAAGTPWSPQQTAKYRMDLQSEMQGQHQNTLLTNAVTRALGGADPTSPQYADTWGKALKAGMTSQILKSKGFTPPPGSEPAPAAAAPKSNGTVSDLIDNVAGHFNRTPSSGQPVRATMQRSQGSKVSDPVSKMNAAPSPRAGIAEKVKAAQAGAYQLTPAETALAKQQGLI